MPDPEDFDSLLHRLDQSVVRLDQSIAHVGQTLDRIERLPRKSKAVAAETAVQAVLVLHDRPHWCFDLNGGSSWYSRDNHWPCLTLDAILGAGYEI